MTQKIKKSVATLFVHIIKIDERSVDKEAPLFCKLMKLDFNCKPDEALSMVNQILSEDYDLDEHLEIINNAVADDIICKFHIMEQLNHLIYSDKITVRDYKEFDRVKDKLFGKKVSSYG